MKIRSPIFNFRFPVEKKPAAVARRQSAIALVLTLILLSVTLVMAVAFLFISRREQGSVVTQTDTATARYAADAALANAEKQITANILSSAQPNPYNLGLLVSTNFINPLGFAPGFTNVNYNYDTTFASLTPDEFLQNLTNLFYAPRPPVFIPTNGTAGGYDFRFYLDLNRNGVYDTNGVTGDFDANGFTGTSSFKVGDPEWIGVLEHPDQPYGPNNKFVARYAFIALPVGDSLDLNAIHNQTLQENNISLVMASDGYFRNQGVGSWEINLAAFLADLNTNQWGLVVGSGISAPPGSASFYQYNQPSSPNLGVAFEDAFSILTNRYAGSYSTLASVQNLFGINGTTAFQNDNIDGYSDGPLQTGFESPGDVTIPNPNDNPLWPWAGANNTNYFFYLPSELFNSAESSAGFVQRLSTASAGADTYDRYTFYRLLSQLGTDSDPESGRMNLNYDNLDAFGNVVPGAETNFIPWTPLRFFTNAADRMLREYSAEWATTYFTNGLGFVVTEVNTNFVATFNVTNAFGITNIPVWVSNRFVYTPAVQRVLQLAANIYDATTNNSSAGSPDWPDVFRPLFSSDINGNVFITGYTSVTTMTDPTTDSQMLLPVDVSSISGSNVLVNVYGVPWIIGAKKGLPNFNAFSMQSVFQITRKLQFTRSSTNVNYLFSPNSYTLSQQLTLALTNSLGVEFWNSYSSNFIGNNLQVWVYDTNYLAATNDEGAVYNNGMSAGLVTNLTLWPGAGNISLGVNPHSFIVPLNTNFWALPMSVYQFGNLLQPFNTNLANAGPNPTFYTNYLQPQWTLLTTNRLRVVILDEDTAGNYHVLDYVQLSGPDATLTNQFVTGQNPGYGQSQWEVTSNNQGIPYGFNNQIGVSSDQPRYYPAHISDWDNTDSTTVENEIDGFMAFMYGPNSLIYRNPGNESNVVAMAVSTNAQVPYTPSQWIVLNTSWEANDPLVHYTASDLTDLTKSQDAQYIYTYGAFQGIQPPIPFGALNTRYMPWGYGLSVAGTDNNPYNLAFKDPLVWQSDNWDFPTGKLPTAGWIGRVHRGTPWQTVYLKSTNLMDLNFKDAKGNTISGPTTWIYWTGNGIANDQFNNAPVEDRLLFDLFTTKFNDNATRGQLSVNVGAQVGAHNLAAWSALFSGVMVLSNNLPDNTIYLAPQASYTAAPISPAGPYDSTLPLAQQPPLAQVAAGIDQTRSNFRNRDGLTGAFEHTGDILATPQLSDQSPFLNLLTTNGTPDYIQQTNGVSDEMYEWLPQQVMSLLRVGSSRYVIYCYGQTLKPAPNGIYLGAGNYFGMVTNYQVTAESATRAVVRFTPTNAVIENFNVLPPD